MNDKRRFEIRSEGCFADGQMLPVATLSQEVDLTPFYLQSIEYNGRTFEFLKPLQLTPEHDETQQLYCLEEQDLGIDVYAYTRDQLDVELKEQIAFLWDDYAQVPGEELTDAAIRLKQNLLAAVREVPHAA